MGKEWAMSDYLTLEVKLKLQKVLMKGTEHSTLKHNTKDKQAKKREI